MIYDLLKNIERYEGISKNLDTAIKFIKKQDLDALPLGRTDIDDHRVFVNVMEAVAKSEDEIYFEVHKKYMDIQIDLEGIEAIETAVGDLEEITPYDEGKDIGFYRTGTSARCIMGSGRFSVCMAEEAHKPGIACQDERVLKKCVIKVAVEE